MSLILRNAIAADIEPLGLVGYAAWCEGLKPLLPEEVHHKVSPTDFAELVRDLPHEVLVAELDGVPVALGATELGDDEISDLWVSPGHAGKGLGTALLAAMEAVILARGHDGARIQVMTRNTRAFGLYRHRGYIVTWQGMQWNSMLGIDTEKTHLRKPLR